LDVTVSATTKSKLLWETQPTSSVTAGTTWTTFRIEITDPYGNRTGDTDDITITPSTGSFTSGTTTKAASSGLATFNDITYTTADTITITGWATGLTGTSASNSVTVNPASTSYYSLDSPVDITAGGTEAAYTVTRYDQYNNLVASGSETVYLFTNSTGNNAAFRDSIGGTAITSVAIASSTSASNFWYYDEKAGDWTITASDATPADAALGIRDAQDAITVNPASAAKLLWVTQPATSVTAGAIWTAFSVEITDQYGNRTSDTDNITMTPSSGSFTSGTTTKAAVSGLVTFDDITYTATATITVSGSSSILAGTPASNSVTISPANLDHFVWSSIGTQKAGTAFTATLTAQDAYNNNTFYDTNGSAFTTIESVRFTTTATASPDGTKPTYAGADLTDGEVVTVDLSTGSFTTSNIILYDSAELPTVTITHDAKTGTSGTVTVNAEALDHFLWGSVSGAAFTTTITAQDIYDNTTIYDANGSLFATSATSESVTFTTTATASLSGEVPTYDGAGNDLTDGETDIVDLSTGSFTTAEFRLYNETETPPTITITHDGKTGTSAAITVKPEEETIEDDVKKAVDDWEEHGNTYIVIPKLEPVETVEILESGYGIVSLFEALNIAGAAAAIAVKEYGFDLDLEVKIIDAEIKKNNLYAKKWYLTGNYTTTVKVRKGKAMVATYDNKGPKYDTATSLTEGQGARYRGGVKGRKTGIKLVQHEKGTPK
ncbi:hypothetical protein ACFL5Y_01765, partial [Candidatus Omnitrophota bacterium]